jgi:hypothetical protein
MNTKSDLQEIYWDLLKLADEFDALPERCPCREASRCSGQCCCHVGPLELASVSMIESCGGCLHALRRLIARVDFLGESLHGAIDGRAANGRSVEIGGVLDRLDRTTREIALALRRIGTGAMLPGAGCMHELLAPMRGRGRDLRRPLADLEHYAARVKRDAAMTSTASHSHR